MNNISKKIFIVGIVLIIMLILLVQYSIRVANIKIKDSEQTKIAIYPTGGLDETYYFVLNTDGKLLAEKGTRFGDDLRKNSFIRKGVNYDYKKETKHLSTSELNEIYNLINKVYESDSNYTKFYDSWDIQILYKNKIIKQNINYLPQIKNLVNKIIDISPIEIDLHNWS